MAQLKLIEPSYLFMLGSQVQDPRGDPIQSNQGSGRATSSELYSTVPKNVDSKLFYTETSEANSELPAVESFIILNRASGGSRRIAPLSPLAVRYVAKIQSITAEDHYFRNTTTVPLQQDTQEWLTTIAPGRLVITFLADIGLPVERRSKGFQRMTRTMDLDGNDSNYGFKQHLESLLKISFDPKE
ncbi:hypothetical protein FBU30_003134 [Linnemannia zychae]|nr:hypothetical protein FBU30_003134 [Linnemannia zychae]